MIGDGVVNMSCTSFCISAVSAGAPPLERHRHHVSILNTSAASAPELRGVASATFSELGLAFAS